MSEEGKVSGDQWYPVVLLDDTDFKTGETGKVVGDLTVEYKKLGAGAGWSAYGPAAGDWQELGDGEYAMNMGAGEFSSAGRWQVHVQCGGCLTYRFSVEVRSFTLEELFTGANLVTFKLKQLEVINSTGDAIVARSTGSNGRGITAEGNGSGPGLKVLGGTSGPGFRADGGTGGNTNGIEAYGVTGGNGMQLNAGLTGNGLKVYGGGTSGAAIRAIAQSGGSDAVLLEGQDVGSGLKSVGGVSGNGVTLQGGASIGHGIHATAPGSTGLSYAMLLERNGQTVGVGAALRAVVTGGASMAAVELLGKGSKAGLDIDGGTTGNGVEITGVATGLKITGGQSSSQGHGIHVLGGETVGAGDFHAVFLEANGVAASGLKTKGDGTGHGILSQSGAGATGDGIKAEALSTDGKGIEALGSGAGAGLHAKGGLTDGFGIHGEAQANGDGIRGSGGTHGEGITGYGGSTEGFGILAIGVGDGHGFYAHGNGPDAHGIYARSGSGATGDGIRAESSATNGNGLNTIKTGTGIDLKATDHGDGSWQEDGFRKNTASTNFEFEMVQLADHITPALGAAITAQRSIDGGAYGACTNAAVPVGLGTYKIDFSAADLNGDIITFKFSAAACDTRTITIKTYTP